MWGEREVAGGGGGDDPGRCPLHGEVAFPLDFYLSLSLSLSLYLSLSACFSLTHSLSLSPLFFSLLPLTFSLGR